MGILKAICNRLAGNGKWLLDYRQSTSWVNVGEFERGGTLELAGDSCYGNSDGIFFIWRINTILPGKNQFCHTYSASMAVGGRDVTVRTFVSRTEGVNDKGKWSYSDDWTQKDRSERTSWIVEPLVVAARNFAEFNAYLRAPPYVLMLVD